MIPASFDYVRAKSLRDALNAIGTDGTKVLAGGHSLIPMMRFRLAQPGRLLDIGQLAELKGIDLKGRGARIGAGTSYRELLDSPELAERYPLIAEATRGIGDVQVRNRGTIGGGLAHADPASDMPAVMLALGATFNLRSKGGKRSVAAADFFTGAFTTALASDELLIDIALPAPPKKAGMAYASFEQKASGYAIAAAAAVVTKSRKTITGVTLALTGVGDRAYLADASGAVGSHGDDAALEAAVANVTKGIDVNGDIHASVEYRSHLARVVARRAIALALSRAG
ncbi:MAG: xanthine dehydrogenase family protein subunit M [Gemmatimonadetes bacterium]|nr:xanthine dehydrogenase family protein subunit M [Gemmatimonadota bacterium]